MLQLNVKRGLYRKTYSFDDPDIITIGKQPTNDVVLPDNRVSRYHAAIVRAAGEPPLYFVRDLASLHGVREGQSYISQQRLHDGDKVSILDFDLQFFDGVRISPPSNLFCVVKRKTDYMTTGQSTIPLSGLGPDSLSTPDRREIASAVRRATTTADARQVFSTIMGPLVRVLSASRGFAAFFTDIENEYLYVGVTGLEFGQTVEISATDFLDNLRENKPVQDGRTLLAPIVTDQGAAGFICVDRLPPAPEFSQDDSAFLQALGSAPELHLQKFGDDNSEADRALRWRIDRIEKGSRVEEMHRQIDAAARSDRNVLVWGESGTGKEGVANAIHRQSKRRGALFALNCAELNEHLAQVQLFGYKARSGIENADPQGAPGVFEATSGGTVFLDEIQALTIPNQEKLLRVLEQKKVVRIGENRERPVDVLVIAATSQDLKKTVEEGGFLDALYFRFGTTIALPPLRDRIEDIPLLVHFFLDNWAFEHNVEPREISHEAMKVLLQHAWKGNIRELKNTLDGAAESGSKILFSWDFDFKDQWLASEFVVSGRKTADSSETGDLRKSPTARIQSIEQFEEEKLREALQATKGNVTQTAQCLNWVQQTVRNKMKKYSIPLGYGRQ